MNAAPDRPLAEDPTRPPGDTDRAIAANVAELIADGLGAKDCTLVAKLASPDGTLRGYDPSLDRTLEGTRS